MKEVDMVETNEEVDDVEDESISVGGDSRVMALMSGDEVAGRYRLRTFFN